MDVCGHQVMEVVFSSDTSVSPKRDYLRKEISSSLPIGKIFVKLLDFNTVYTLDTINKYFDLYTDGVKLWPLLVCDLDQFFLNINNSDIHVPATGEQKMFIRIEPFSLVHSPKKSQSCRKRTFGLVLVDLHDVQTHTDRSYSAEDTVESANSRRILVVWNTCKLLVWMLTGISFCLFYDKMGSLYPFAMAGNSQQRGTVVFVF